MLVKNQYAEVKWSKTNKKHYMNKGYNFTRLQDKFIIRVEDLTSNSHVNVKVICDNCKKKFEINYATYFKSIQKNNTYLCRSCAVKKSYKTRLAENQDIYYNIALAFCEKYGYLLITNKNEIETLQSRVTYSCPKHGKHTTTIGIIKGDSPCINCSREDSAKKLRKATLAHRRDHLYRRAILKCEEKGYKLFSKKEEIESNKTIIKYICPKHGMKDIKINNLLSGKGCPMCSYEDAQKRYSLHTDEVERRVDECGGFLFNKEDYVNSSTKNLRIACPECNQPFLTSLQNFTQHQGQVCSNCASKESIGEKKIRLYLKNNKLDFEQEKWFPDCRDVKPLPFDFYIPSQKCIIEFDGRQHFADTDYFKYSFEKVKEHDDIKNNYCKNNNIKLIRIPYWDTNNIEKILNKEISHEDIV